MIYRVHQDDSFLIHEVPAVESMTKLGEQYGTFAFNPEPISYKKVWRPLTIEFKACEPSTKNVIPDISENFARLFFTENAYQLLNEVLASCGEFLPINYQDGAGYVFNPLTTAESLNAVNSKLLVYDEHGNLVHYGFYEEILPPLFKTELDNCTRLFCTEVFKAAVEAVGLTGVRFNPDIANPQDGAYGVIQ